MGEVGLRRLRTCHADPEDLLSVSVGEVGLYAVLPSKGVGEGLPEVFAAIPQIGDVGFED